jgi:rubrerythrin
MDMIRLLRRCTQVEQKAAEIYDTLARAFADDPEVARMWWQMASDERDHAKKLGTWRRLLERSPRASGIDASSFDPAVRELEVLARDLRKRTGKVHDLEQAFAIALTLEVSELDTIYALLLQASPIARFPDIDDTRRIEVGGHHRALIDMVRARSHDERNLTDAALLAVER